jgi:GDP-mannose 4,6-dehydratase
MKKRVLITGVSGMVGSHLLDFLYENTDWDLFGLLRWRSPLENIQSHIDNINKKKRVFLEYGDIRDTLSINEVIKNVRPDYVFHLAAQSFPKTSFSSPLDTYDTNIQGTTNVLEAIKNYSKNAKVHVCSSSEVFGRVKAEDIPIKEDTNFHPASPYAISKVGTDLIGRFYAEAYKMCVITTRMFTHTGPRRGDVFAESSFAKQIALAEAGLSDDTIYVGNLESLRTIADVRDAVKAYFMLLTIRPIGGEYYNIGGDYTVKISELLDDLINLSTKKDVLKIKVDHDRLRPIDADLQVPDIEKFKKHTGWKPEIKYEQTLIDLLNYWRNVVASKGTQLKR